MIRFKQVVQASNLNGQPDVNATTKTAVVATPMESPNHVLHDLCGRIPTTSGKECRPFFVLFCVFKQESIGIPLKHIIMLSYNVKLTADPEGRERLLRMLRQHAEAWDMVSQDTFKNGVVDPKIIHDRNYYRCRKEIAGILSQVTIRAICSVHSAFRTIKANGDLSRMKDAPKNSNLAIRLDKRISKFIPGDGIAVSTSEGRIECRFKPYPILRRMMNMSTPHDPLIFVRDGDIYLSLSFDAPNPLYIENRHIGVDLGIRRFTVTSDGLVYSDKSYLKRRRQIRYLRGQLRRRKELYGSNSASRHLKKIARKERNQSRNMLHHVSNAILSSEADTIIMEDLSKIKENTKGQGRRHNSRQSQVPYYALRQMLTWKAQARGKRVATVNPAYTSRKDCRGLPDGVRKGCRYKGSDGTMLDADWNAAVNILNRYLHHHKLPLSPITPLDGAVGPWGRPTSAGRTSEAA